MSDVWESYPLQSLVIKVGSGSTPKGGSEAYKAVGIPLIRSMNVVFFGFKRAGLAYIDADQAAQLDNATVKAGDVLLNITGASIGRVTLAPEEFDGARVNQHVCIIRPNEALDARFLNAYLSSPALQSRIWNDNFGVTRQALTKQQILDFEVPLPPRSEQTRIVNQLNTLLTRIQSCNDRFDAISALLKRFRQTVLDAATSGQLSADWRAGGIEKWEYLRAGDVCAKVQSGGTPKEGFSEQGVPFLKVYNIVNQKVAFDYKPQYISQDIHAGSMSKSQTQPGDVLMNIVGPPLGKVAIVTAAHPTWNINQALTLFRPSSRITTGWIYYVLCGGVNIAEIVHETRGSAGQVNISLSQCRDFVFPVPPIAEQTEIVRRVEALFSLADHLEARAYAARTHAQRLSPLLLAKAFRGELVPQDPQDEPASELLNRIAAAQSSTPKKHGVKTATRRTPKVKPQDVSTSESGDKPLDATMKLDLVPDNYLETLISVAEGVSAKELWQKSKLAIDDFYIQLSNEMGRGLLEVDAHDESRVCRSAASQRGQA